MAHLFCPAVTPGQQCEKAAADKPELRPVARMFTRPEHEPV